MKFRTIVDYIPDPGQGDFSVSMTVPDQSLSVREILDRFTRNTLDMSIVKKGHFTDENDLDLDDPLLDRNFDLADASSMLADSDVILRSKKAVKRDTVIQQSAVDSPEEEETERSEVPDE